MKRELLIVVLNYNSFVSTIRCVTSIKNSNKGLRDFDIVIADNCSTNDSYNELRTTFDNENDVTVVRTDKNGGYSYGNNYAIRYMLNRGLQYKFIAIVNPDVVFKDKFLEYQMNVLNKNKNYSAISCLVATNGKVNFSNQAWLIPSAKELCLRTFLLCKNKNVAQHTFNIYENSVVETEILPGSYFMIKADIFEKIGFFDENVFMYNEETILSIKLKEQGKKSLFDLSHIYFHNHKKLPREEVWKAYKNNFTSVFRMYEYFYDSREYVCEHYYNSQKRFLMGFIIAINKFLIFLKHLLSLIKVS